MDKAADPIYIRVRGQLYRPAPYPLLLFFQAGSHPHKPTQIFLEPENALKKDVAGQSKHYLRTLLLCIIL